MINVYYNHVISGNLPNNWRSLIDKTQYEKAIVQSIKESLYGFSVATAFKFKNVHEIYASTDIISLANDSKSIPDLFELFTFNVLSRNAVLGVVTKKGWLQSPGIMSDINSILLSFHYDYIDRSVTSQTFDNLSVFTDEYSKKKLGNVQTPHTLASEITKHGISDIKDNQKILDPAGGVGTFIFAARQLFPNNQYFYNDIDPIKCYISNGILNTGEYTTVPIFCSDFLTEFDDAFLTFVKNMNNLIRQYQNDDSLLWEIEVKFDVIIGNSPFQENWDNGTRKAQSKSLYPQFIEKSVAICNSNGYVALISPVAWMSPYDSTKIKTKNGLNSGNYFKSLFREFQIKHIEVGTLKKYFPNVGSSFSYFVLEKTAPYGMTTVSCQFNNQLYSSSIKIEKDLSVMPLLLTEDSISIVNKIFDTPNKIQLIDGKNLHSSPMSKNQIKVHKEQSKVNKYPIWHTNSQILWSPERHANQLDKKVLISKPGYFKPIYDSGKYGVADNSWAIVVGTKEHGTALVSYLNSKLITFLMLITKFNGFNTPRIIKQIPLIDLTKVWTDKEIYNYFKLTDAEIQLIEDTVK